jgi:hypothetical protein
MNRNKFNEFADKFLAQAKSIMDTKGKHYAGDEDVFRCIKKESERIGITPLQCMMVFMGKHIEALYEIAQGKKDEEVDTRCADIVNYCIMMSALLEEEKREACPDLYRNSYISGEHNKLYNNNDY